MAKVSAFPTPAEADLQAVPAESGTSDEATLDLEELLDLAIEKEASDVHFGTGSKIALRLFGEIRFVETAGKLSKSEAERLIFGLLKNKTEQDKLRKQHELDFSHQHTDGTIFRCHAFFRSGRISIVMRRMPKSVLTFDQLGLPPAVNELVQARQGLIIVCGPAGSGKSTTLAAILEAINESRAAHVVTIEDPIKYLFTDQKCVFSQRELHRDTESFQTALHTALRQDSDIILLSELSDPEVITAALSLCEKGRLVLGTLHTTSAAETVERLVQAFPVAQREPLLARLSDNLTGIINQRLLPKINGGRVGIYELLLANGVVRDAIRQGNIFQLDTIVAHSEMLGMVDLKKSAQNLVDRGVVDIATVQE